MQVLALANDHVFGYVHTPPAQEAGPAGVVVLTNFSKRPQQLPANELRLYGLSYRFHDLVQGQTLQPPAS